MDWRQTSCHAQAGVRIRLLIAIRSVNLGEAKGQALRSILAAKTLLDSKGVGIVVRSAVRNKLLFAAGWSLSV